MAAAIRLAKKSELNKVVALYDTLNDYLQSSINYPRWKKGQYPSEITATEGFEANGLYIMEVNGEIAGTIILISDQPKQYEKLSWGKRSEAEKTLVIHALAVHPKFLKRGVASQLLDFAQQLAVSEGMETIRLDVFEENYPAQNLYTKKGYKCVGTVDLELNIPDLVMFKCFEKIL